MKRVRGEECPSMRAWTSKPTLDCVAKGCIPCIYKIFPETRGLPSNKRPETCCRHGDRVLVAPIKEQSSVLAVGDGDFTYSLSLAASNNFKLLATSYEKESTLVATYPCFPSTLASLTSCIDTEVKFEVDATNLDKSLLADCTFDTVVWNFPCVCSEVGADGQVDQLADNKQLLSAFFESVKPYLRDGKSTVHVTHKTIEPFSWWGLEALAESAGFAHVASIHFDICCYPGYVNRKALDKKSFPANDAKIFVFQLLSPDNKDQMAMQKAYGKCLKALGFAQLTTEVTTSAVDSFFRSQSRGNLNEKNLNSNKKHKTH